MAFGIQATVCAHFGTSSPISFFFQILQIYSVQTAPFLLGFGCTSLKVGYVFCIRYRKRKRKERRPGSVATLTTLTRYLTYFTKVP